MPCCGICLFSRGKTQRPPGTYPEVARKRCLEKECHRSAEHGIFRANRRSWIVLHSPITLNDFRIPSPGMAIDTAKRIKTVAVIRLQSKAFTVTLQRKNYSFHILLEYENAHKFQSQDTCVSCDNWSIEEGREPCRAGPLDVIFPCSTEVSLFRRTSFVSGNISALGVTQSIG